MNNSKIITLPNSFLTRIKNKQQLIYLINRYDAKDGISDVILHTLQICNKHKNNPKYIYIQIENNVIKGFVINLKYYNKYLPNFPRISFTTIRNNEKEILATNMVRWIKETKKKL